MAKGYVSDVINKEYIKWAIGDDVTINFQTGGRKTTFILEVFAPHLGQINNSAILYLVSRIELKKYIENKINKNFITNITVMTYQALEAKILNDEDRTYNYQYIVCDECHYFVEDAWNRKTQVSWEYIIKQKALRIWMSGTGRHVFKFIENIQLNKKNGKHYRYDGVYNYDFIEKLNFFNVENKFDYITNTLKEIPSDEKAIYFCSEKKLGKKIYQELERPAFYYFSDCKKSNFKKTAELLEDRFDEDILIATSVIDTGISFRDEKIRHIITDIPNVETIVQCIGRKRLSEGEKIILHICNYNRKEIRAFMREKDKYVTEIEKYFFTGKKDEYLKQYEVERKLPTNFYLYYAVSEKEFKLNGLYYMADALQVNDFKKIIAIGFDEYIINNCFKGISMLNVINYEQVQLLSNKQELEEYLNFNLGKKLFKDDKEKLNFIMNKFIKTNSKTLKLKTINNYLIVNNLKYEIKSGKEGSKKDGKAGQNYYIIKKINES